MPLVSVTRLRLRKRRFLAGFAWYSALSWLQAKRAPGNIQARALRDRGLTFWTITVWSSEETMRGFRNAGNHGRAMSRLARWCDEATYVHWVQAGDEAPDLQTAHTRLMADGVVSKLMFPSPAHAVKNFPAPVLPAGHDRP